MEITIKIDKSSKQAEIILEMLKTFDFVRFISAEEITSRKKAKSIKAISKEINKSGTKKAFAELGLNCDSYNVEQFVDAISKKVNKGVAEKWYEKSGMAY